ncbi:MAG: hypothetical protein SGPRY_012114, partial [Prymnesium sp.]
MGWIRSTVASCGPILVSMLGRLFHEQFGHPFADEWSEGEVLVDLRDPADPRAFVKTAKKLKAVQKVMKEMTGRLAIDNPAEAYTQLSGPMLVVGEADFSWAASVVKHASSSAITATSFDSHQTVCSKYGADLVNRSIRILHAAGASVMHGIDATALGEQAELTSQGPYDLVVFHFPHTGTDQGLQLSISANQQLLRDFLLSARGVLTPQGEVHITLVHRYPYTTWLGELAVGKSSALRGAGLRYLGSVKFDFSQYSGYKHQVRAALASVNVV